MVHVAARMPILYCLLMLWYQPPPLILACLSFLFGSRLPDFESALLYLEHPVLRYRAPNHTALQRRYLYLDSYWCEYAKPFLRATIAAYTRKFQVLYTPPLRVFFCVFFFPYRPQLLLVPAPPAPAPVGHA